MLSGDSIRKNPPERLLYRCSDSRRLLPLVVLRDAMQQAAKARRLPAKLAMEGTELPTARVVSRFDGKAGEQTWTR